MWMSFLMWPIITKKLPSCLHGVWFIKSLTFLPLMEKAHACLWCQIHLLPSPCNRNLSSGEHIHMEAMHYALTFLGVFPLVMFYRATRSFFSPTRGILSHSIRNLDDVDILVHPLEEIVLQGELVDARTLVVKSSCWALLPWPICLGVYITQKHAK